jgi:hypothetical protein
MIIDDKEAEQTLVFLSSKGQASNIADLLFILLS